MLCSSLNQIDKPKGSDSVRLRIQDYNTPVNEQTTYCSSVALCCSACLIKG